MPTEGGAAAAALIARADVSDPRQLDIGADSGGGEAAAAPRHANEAGLRRLRRSASAMDGRRALRHGFRITMGEINDSHVVSWRRVVARAARSLAVVLMMVNCIALGVERTRSIIVFAFGHVHQSAQNCKVGTLGLRRPWGLRRPCALATTPSLFWCLSFKKMSG